MYLIICVDRAVPADQSAAGWFEESCWDWRRSCRCGYVSSARRQMLQAHKKWDDSHNNYSVYQQLFAYI